MAFIHPAGEVSMLKKRSVVLSGHATSVALEPEFWAVLDAIAAARGVSQAGLLAWIDETRGRRPLASACRVLALAWASSKNSV
jgi:predicted DNA-binding ribbon-helix-helix protein